MSVKTVTYCGKPGKSDDEALPVPGIPQPFRPGESRKFTKDYLLSLGVDPANADAFIDGPEGFVTLFNANRPEDMPLFKVKGGSSDSNTGSDDSTTTSDADASATSK